LENDDPSEEEERQFGARRAAANIFDPTAMSFDRFQCLPMGVIWALSRASSKIPRADEDDLTRDFQAAGKEFERLMNLPGKSMHIALGWWLIMSGAPRDV
jgi:hypothetical protein